jgi:hypothetical protein
VQKFALLSFTVSTGFLFFGNAQASQIGHVFTYDRKVVFHGEYEIDACELTVQDATGKRLYTEFKGEYWPTESLCSDLQLNESKQYKIESTVNNTVQCFKIGSDSKTLSLGMFCKI